MAECQNQRIIDFLKKNNADPSTISHKQLSNLEKVDEEIQKRVKLLGESAKAIKSNDINISSIAKATGISNKTFYNNALLKKYVDQYTGNDTGKSVSEQEYDRIKQENVQLKEQVQKMLKRDVDAGIKDHEIEQLQKQISNLEQRNQSLQEQYESVVQQLNSPSKVICFPQSQSGSNK